MATKLIIMKDWATGKVEKSWFVDVSPADIPLRDEPGIREMADAPPKELWNRLNRECFLDSLPEYMKEHAEVRSVEVPTWPPGSGTRTVWEVWVDGMHVIPAEFDHVYIYKKGGDAERFDGGHCAEICNAVYRMIAEKEG